jgi:ATP-dependent protease HslVU (ClpYQ) peptidase subunit
VVGVTTIVAIQGDDWVLVATDSRISSFDGSGMATQSSTLSAGTSKVAQNGKYLLGAAGDVRAINLLHHALQPPAPPPNLAGRKLDAFITTRFIPAMRECFETHGYATPDNDDKQHMAEHASTVLVVVNAHAYIVDGDYSWATDTSGIYAIGSGAPYALGAIHALRNGRTIDTPQQAKNLATKALTITGRLDPYTGTPVQTHTQTHETPPRNTTRRTTHQHARNDKR